MNWNHRVVRVTSRFGDETETLYMLAEVFYNDDGTPAGYTKPFMQGESKIELVQLVDRLAAAIEQPVLNGEDMKWVDNEEYDEETDEMRELPRKSVINQLIDDRVNDLIRSTGCTVATEPDEEEILDANYNAETLCALCGRAEPCDECKGAA